MLGEKSIAPSHSKNKVIIFLNKKCMTEVNESKKIYFQIIQDENTSGKTAWLQKNKRTKALFHYCSMKNIRQFFFSHM